MAIIFLAPEPWAEGPGVGLGLLAPEISLLNFYPPHVGEGPACFESVLHLPVWMDVVAFNSVVVRLPFSFLTVLSDGCFVF